MNQIAISVENLSKVYYLGQIGTGTFRNDLLVWWAKKRGKPNPTLKIGQVDQITRDGEELWALRDINFLVEQGNALGIIGKNGAGKSTLLKILSRITAPSKGKIKINGRVASLLEVGTGFHPDLTGRENIYLNGAILGMNNKEIAGKLEEIVDFADVAKFVDTPVKRYSSGMYVRLAFSVAAHLEPDILVVDEVLAVGDSEFQNKCLGKMGEVANQGRTVLFVSHNMVAIKKLCKKCLWIDHGAIKEIGIASKIVDNYLSDGLFQNGSHSKDLSNIKVKGDGRVKLLSFQISNGNDQLIPIPRTNEDLFIRVRLFVKEPINQPACGISIQNSQGVLMTSINTVELGANLSKFPSGEISVKIKLSKVSFLPGSYIASFWVMNPQSHIYVFAEDALRFEIGQGSIYGTREIDHRWGCVYTKVDFLIE